MTAGPGHATANVPQDEELLPAGPAEFGDTKGADTCDDLAGRFTLGR